MAKVSFHNKNEKQNGWGKITGELQLGLWKSLHSDQSIIDARRNSNTAAILEQSLTDCKRPKRT